MHALCDLSFMILNSCALVEDQNARMMYVEEHQYRFLIQYDARVRYNHEVSVCIQIGRYRRLWIPLLNLRNPGVAKPRPAEDHSCTALCLMIEVLIGVLK